MSVTFWMPQAPVMRVEPYPEEEPGYFEEVPAPPFTELNMANGNAADMLALIAPGSDPLCGTWGVEKVESVWRRTMVVLNKDPEAFLLDGYAVGRLHVGGRDMDYVTRRLNEMLVLLTVARQHGFEVCYG